MDSKKPDKHLETVNKKTKFIGLAGGSGSGKTTIADAFAKAQMGRTEVLSMDNYFIDFSGLRMEELETTNFDHPEAFQLDRLERDLQSLKTGNSIEAPLYDLVLCRASGTRMIQALDYVLVEGLFSLQNAPIRENLDFLVFVDCPESLRLSRQLVRSEEGRIDDIDSRKRRFEKYVAPMHKKFIEPSKQFADLVLRNDSNDDSLITDLSDQILKAVS